MIYLSIYNLFVKHLLSEELKVIILQQKKDNYSQKTALSHMSYKADRKENT